MLKNSTAVSCQIHQHKTGRLTPDSRQTQNPPDAITTAFIASLSFLATRVATVRVLFRFSIARTAHSSSYASQLLVVILKPKLFHYTQ
jgi:hypothetical protein